MGDSSPALSQGSSLLCSLDSEPLPAPLATMLTGPMLSLLANLAILTPCHLLPAVGQKSPAQGHGPEIYGCTLLFVPFPGSKLAADRHF